MNAAGGRDRAMTRPATAAEAWAALVGEGPAAEAVRSYLAPGPEPRYDTPEARAQAEARAETNDPEPEAHL